MWLDYDLVNIELRTWGYSVGNKEMVELFDDKKSFHMEIAKMLYPKEIKECEDLGIHFKEKYKATLYQWVKNGNFSIIYGGKKKKVDKTFKFPNAYDIVVERFPEVDDFAEQKIQEVLDNDAKYNIPFVTCMGGYPLEVDIQNIHTTACNYFSLGS